MTEPERAAGGRRSRPMARSGIAALAGFVLLCLDVRAVAQDQRPPPPIREPEAARSFSEKVMRVPVTGLVPNEGGAAAPDIPNPVARDPEALGRGMRYFTSFNCAGCHAPNGGGGMGRSLSNAHFIYGHEPANIFLSIQQGRPNGMPAWGGMLPDSVIWDLVAYIQSISRDPEPPWGRTISVQSFDIEQVPAEFMKTTTPWKHTQPFSYGKKPLQKPKP